MHCSYLYAAWFMSRFPVIGVKSLLLPVWQNVSPCGRYHVSMALAWHIPTFRFVAPCVQCAYGCASN